MTVVPSAGSVRGSRLIVAGGNFLQFFDWILYSLLAPVFATQFFGGDRLSAAFQAFLVYGGSLLLRPLGGALVGRFADRHGRRRALMIGVGAAGVASLAIAVLPGRSTIGVAAPVLLVLARALAALAFGGEWPTAVTYLMESARRGTRLVQGSYFVLTCTAGGFAASALGTLMSATLGPAALQDWGWRVPFAVAGVTSLVLCVLRRGLAETPAYLGAGPVEPAERRPGSIRPALAVAALAAAASVTTTTFSVTVPAIAQDRLGASPTVVLGANTVVTGALVVLVLPIGLLAQRFGLHRTLAFTSIGFVVAVPALYLTIRPTFGGLLLASGVGMLLSTTQGVTLPEAMASVFPARRRGFGVGLSQGIADAVFGGFAPSAALALAASGRDGWYVAIVCGLVLLGWGAIAVVLRSTAGHQLDPLPTDVTV
ncbi:MFS transporter [Amycolatopsis sp. NBC_00345]|uniref:MFS transporter n=1 Tax=Amycolatopsis sp. NBC_00345 TaxID=2975955 RepID=UPI002E25809A